MFAHRLMHSSARRLLRHHRKKSKSSSHASSSSLAKGSAHHDGAPSSSKLTEEEEMRRLVKRQAEQEEEDDEDLDESIRHRGHASSRGHGSLSSGGGKAGSGGSGARKMTEAEKRFEEVQKKRVSRKRSGGNCGQHQEHDSRDDGLTQPPLWLPHLTETREDPQRGRHVAQGKGRRVQQVPRESQRAPRPAQGRTGLIRLTPSASIQNRNLTP
jgi:hypothetical protein